MNQEKRTKFVQFYPDVRKQVEKCLHQFCGEQDLYQGANYEVRIDPPEFDYAIVSQKEVERMVEQEQKSKKEIGIQVEEDSNKENIEIYENVKSI